MSRILVVDDSEPNRDMLARHLKREGYEALLAADGAEAIAVAQTERPDLILMDISLPGMDGWELSRRLKSDDRTRHIPLIAVTAHATENDRATAIEAGCDDFETKPIDFASLFAKIRTRLRVQT